jgi:hypothetical protein
LTGRLLTGRFNEISNWIIFLSAIFLPSLSTNGATTAREKLTGDAVSPHRLIS